MDGKLARSENAQQNLSRVKVSQNVKLGYDSINKFFISTLGGGMSLTLSSIGPMAGYRPSKGLYGLPRGLGCCQPLDDSAILRLLSLQLLGQVLVDNMRSAKLGATSGI